jgi:hypothetical protein
MTVRCKRSPGPAAPKMAGFREECGMLAAVETFDPEAFRGNDEVPQAVCNFVLALALIYNDCKDAIYAYLAVAAFKPDGPPQKTKIWGSIAGVQLHTCRGIAGLLHELFELRRANDDVLRDVFFSLLAQHLHPRSREAWRSLVNVARDASPTDKLGKQLLLLRNKVFFHHDPKAIFAGYIRHFLGPGKNDDRAYVSREDSMRATRFFFADAAATGYLRSLGSDTAGELGEELAETVDRINHGLMMVVRTFIQGRGYSFRLEGER